MRVAVLIVKDVREPYYVNPNKVVSVHRNLTWPGEVYDVEIIDRPNVVTVTMSRESLFQQLGWTADRDEAQPVPSRQVTGWIAASSRFFDFDEPAAVFSAWNDALDDGLERFGDDTFWLMPVTVWRDDAEPQSWTARPEQVPLPETETRD